MLAYPGADLLDITGPLDVFAGASALLPLTENSLPAYTVEIVAHATGPLTTSSGIKLLAERRYTDLECREVDTLMIAGGPGFEEILKDRRLLKWVKHQTVRARRLASICNYTMKLTRIQYRRPSVSLISAFARIEVGTVPRKLTYNFGINKPCHIDIESIKIPDTGIARKATELVQKCSPTRLLNHCLRWFIKPLRCIPMSVNRTSENCKSPWCISVPAWTSSAIGRKTSKRKPSQRSSSTIPASDSPSRCLLL